MSACWKPWYEINRQRLLVVKERFEHDTRFNLVDVEYFTRTQQAIVQDPSNVHDRPVEQHWSAQLKMAPASLALIVPYQLTG